MNYARMKFAGYGVDWGRLAASKEDQGLRSAENRLKL